MPQISILLSKEKGFQKMYANFMNSEQQHFLI